MFTNKLSYDPEVNEDDPGKSKRHETVVVDPTKTIKEKRSTKYITNSRRFDMDTLDSGDTNFFLTAIH